MLGQHPNLDGQHLFLSRRLFHVGVERMDARVQFPQIGSALNRSLKGLFVVY